MNKFEIIIVNIPDKERPVLQIYYNNVYWAQVSQETEELTIQFYPHPTEGCWEFSFDEAFEALEKAKQTCSTNKFEVIIASPEDKEYVVAEIYYNNMYWAQVSQETEELTIQFYPHPTEGCWEFSFDEAFEALEKAKKRLLNE